MRALSFVGGVGLDAQFTLFSNRLADGKKRRFSMLLHSVAYFSYKLPVQMHLASLEH